MKIGIITVQKSEVNYGACFQCYALYYYIKELGYSCEVIDLARPCHDDYVGVRPHDTLRESIHDVLNKIKRGVSLYFAPGLMRRKKSFDIFNRNVEYSIRYHGLEQLYGNPPFYDIFISGSDQIWNPNMPFSNEPYLLTFTSGKKISYATSFGVNSVSDEIINAFREPLKQYSTISVREASSAKIVERILGTPPSVVVDPVFLLSKKQWKDLSVPYKNIKAGEYILLYMLQYDERVIENARAIAIKENLPLYYIISEEKVINTRNCKQLLVSPEEWLWLVDNSKHFITTSFHGTAFSLIFDKPFTVFVDKSKTTNSRIYDLLRPLGMQSVIHSVDDVAIDVNHYTSYATDQLNQSIKTSQNYLESAIKSLIYD